MGQGVAFPLKDVSPMAVLHSLRRWQARIARVAVSLFALTWLGLALAPCHAAPNDTAPPGSLAAPAAHGCHDAATPPPVDPAAGQACPHCPGGHPGTAKCGHGTGLGCSASSAPMLEQRDLTLGKLVLMIPSAWVVLDLGVDFTGPSTPADPTAAPPPCVSLQERYCTHLE